MHDDSLITPEDFYDIVSVEDPQISPDGQWIAFVRVDVDRVENEYRRAIWLASTNGGPPKPFTSGPKQDSAPRWSPDGKHLAFVSSRAGDKPQIYLIATDGGEARRLTNVPQGATHPAWSPDGQFIAFNSRANVEEREREDDPARDEADSDAPQDAFELKQRREAEKHREKQRFDPRVVHRQPYRAGTEFFDDRRTHIYVVDVAAANPDATDTQKAVRRLTDGDIDYAPPVWSPDGASIITSATREPESNVAWMYQDILRIPLSFPEGGREAPVPITGPGFCNLSPRPSPDGRFIAYLRRPEERIFAQYARLALVPSAGGEPREITPGFDRGVNDFRWAPDGSALIFSSGDEGDTGLYAVPSGGGTPVGVVSGRREVLAFDVARDNGMIGFAACTPERPPDLYGAALDGSQEQRLTDWNVKLLERKRVMPVEEIWYAAPDGVEIQGWLVKPPDFDSTKTYPLAVEIHGGPHAMWGPSTMSMWHEWQALAARGYVVFLLQPAWVRRLWLCLCRCDTRPLG